MRIVLVMVLALIAPGAAFAKADVDASLKMKIEGRKVQVRAKVLHESWKEIRHAHGRVQVNVYAGPNPEATKRISKAMMRGSRYKRSFRLDKLCARGMRHLRVKLKVKGATKPFRSPAKVFDLGC
jgi:hypothetical protein